ncbi:MAG: competence/damage-inducible protein A [Bacteroidota bacterium]
MHASLLSIGDELLIGQVVNTNAAWLGEQLVAKGVDLVRVVTLGDDEEEITQALAQALHDTDLVIVTGGLGPTHDDVTRQAVAKHFGVELVFDEAIYAQVQERFARRGLQMPASNRTQAEVPVGFEALPNPVGTAPGLWMARKRGGITQRLAVLPGVPHEMKTMMENEVLPRILTSDRLSTIRQKTLLTAGIGESNLQDEIGDLSDFLNGQVRLAYLPGTNGVRLRLTAQGADPVDTQARLDRFEAYLRQRIGARVYGEDTDVLEAVVGAMLRERGLTLAVAESCTGGLVCHRLTNIPGSSTYLRGGIVAYCNSVKTDLLGVAPDVLEADGAVSQRMALAMAQNVRVRLGADVGVSTTGIAGPGGGTPEKPVGLVWIAYADADGARARKLHFSKDRRINKELTATYVFNLIRQRLLARASLHA